MKFIDICNARFSVRDYQNKPVEREKIKTLLEAARVAPSAVNYQPWIFLVVEKEENRVKVIESYKRDWINSAPCFIIALENKKESWKRKSDMKDFGEVDLSIAIEHICLQAVELGLGTCWVCNFVPSVLIDNFSIPEHLVPVAILPVGYPTEPDQMSKTPKNRKELSEIVRWENL